ncbi:MAG: DUF441 domain-containing protein [Bacillota bacterium]
MDPRLALLVIWLCLGALSRNQLLVSASALLIVAYVTGLPGVFGYLEKQGLELGVLLLTVSVLAPLASGRLGWSEISGAFRGAAGLTAVAAGAVAAVLTRQGVTVLRTHPEVVVGLTVGTLVGAAAFRGVPAGPLVAAGLVAVVWRVLSIR